MRLTDLELYRWKFHNDIYIHTTKSHRPPSGFYSSWCNYWREMGAFVSVLPRQSGKSTMIRTIVNSLGQNSESLSGDYRIVSPSESMRRCLIVNLGLDSSKVCIVTNSTALMGVNYSDINLFIDEFMYVHHSYLNAVLDWPWKSVTMVSSLK